MNNVIDYAKEASKAFKTYISNNQNIDINLCQKIYNYIQNIEYITKTEKKELDIFINENSFDIIHLANIYTNPERKKTLKKQLMRMIPINVSKSNKRIYEARGNISSLININNKKAIKIKRKTYPNTKA